MRNNNKIRLEKNKSNQYLQCDHFFWQNTKYFGWISRFEFGFQKVTVSTEIFL